MFRSLRRIQTERLVVRHHRISLSLPRSQATPKKLQPRKVQSPGPIHNTPTRLLAWASAIDHSIFIPWNQRRILQQLIRRDSHRPWDNLRVSQQVQWLTHVKDPYLPLRLQKRMKFLGLNRVRNQRLSITRPLHPPRHKRQNANRSDRPNLDQDHISPPRHSRNKILLPSTAIPNTPSVAILNEAQRSRRTVFCNYQTFLHIFIQCI
jgi:hypothetical protein